MEKRIKIVWILTLATCLLMIGGQGYWLYNQYNYSVDEYMRDMHAQLLALEKSELMDRFDDKDGRDSLSKKIDRLIRVNCNMQLPDSQSVTGRTQWNIVFYESKQLKSSLNSLRQSDVVLPGEKTLQEKIDSIVVVDSFHVDNISTDVIMEAASRYSAEQIIPFTTARFDSLLRARGFEPVDIQLVTTDTCQWLGSYVKGEKLFSPTMHIVYPYNPLKKEVAEATLIVPLDPLIRQMLWQLIGSVCLVVLLLFCFVYQIKTILKQRRIDEMRKNFVNTMIHELKRPVQTLKMCVAALSDKTMRRDEQVMDEVVRDAMFEIDNLTAYLTKVRDMTRADYENTPLSIRTFDLKETIEKLVRLCNRPAGKKVDITMHFDMDTTLVTADPVHVANIVSNLIENSVKYSYEQVDIHIDCQLHNACLHFSVKDNGIGIPHSAQSRVFEKFYRADNLPDRTIPGIGLGLSYVKLLAEAHHGTVSLQSRPGEGTTVSVSIPQ